MSDNRISDKQLEGVILDHVFLQVSEIDTGYDKVCVCTGIPPAVKMAFLTLHEYWIGSEEFQ